MHHLPSRYIPCDGSLTASAYFDPRSPHGERRYFPALCSLLAKFQSTLPAWGATVLGLLFSSHFLFQSTLPAWGATRHAEKTREQNVFQSTLPAWGATMGIVATMLIMVFQSTLPAWGATHEIEKGGRIISISIHAPRMGSDLRAVTWKGCYIYFNPRSPHGERQCGYPACPPRRYFNPRSPHGERPIRITDASVNELFQSTLPAWGATSAVDW